MGASALTPEYVDLRLTERGRRAVGDWPSADDAAERLADALEAVAEALTDDEERGRVRRLVGELRTLARGSAASAVGGAVVAAGSVGLAG